MYVFVISVQLEEIIALGGGVRTREWREGEGEKG
jgi:hypothetical protein